MKKTKSNYFTLMELLIVMFLLITIGTTMTIGTTKAIRQQKFQSGCEKIESLLNTAQSIAMVYQENVKVIIVPDTRNHSLLCTIETEYALNQSIYKPVRVEGVSVSFQEGQRIHQNEKIELVFKNDFSSFPKGTFEITAYHSFQQEGKLKKKIYLPGYPQLIGLAFNESSDQNAPDSHEKYPKEVLANIDE